MKDWTLWQRKAFGPEMSKQLQVIKLYFPAVTPWKRTIAAVASH